MAKLLNTDTRLLTIITLVVLAVGITLKVLEMSPWSDIVILIGVIMGLLIASISKKKDTMEIAKPRNKNRFLITISLVIVIVFLLAYYWYHLPN